MELNQNELKCAAAIAGDMDLMNMARDYTGLQDTRVPAMQVLEALHSSYHGGVANFYNEKKF